MFIAPLLFDTKNYRNQPAYLIPMAELNITHYIMVINYYSYKNTKYPIIYCNN